jgi:CRP-like cAMP-binding protein
MILKIRECLKDNIIFGGLNPEGLEVLAGAARFVRFARDEILFQEGEEATGFFNIVNGQVKVYKESKLGKEQVLHIFGPGEPVGEVSVFLGHPYPASCIALAPVEVLYIPRREFTTLITGHPDLALELLAVLAERLHYFSRLISNLTLAEAPIRLARFLLLQMGETGAAFNLPFPKNLLAQVLGITPETLSRTFARLEAAGLISVEGKRIIILDRQGLQYYETDS